MTPQQVFPSSLKSVWWKCPKGHSWTNTILKQAQYNSCPICTGRRLEKGVNDLLTTDPDLASEWNQEKNGKLYPTDFTRSSGKKVWWKCKECGTEWQQAINIRIHAGCGCPSCSTKKARRTRAINIKHNNKDLISLFPQIAAEWDYEKNEDLDPSMLSPGSNHKVWWVCPKGHHYRAWINDRTGSHKSGCPYCAGKRKLSDLDNDP